MTGAEITERMRVLLDAALAHNFGKITTAQYQQIVACGVDMPRQQIDRGANAP